MKLTIVLASYDSGRALPLAGACHKKPAAVKELFAEFPPARERA
jgi:hypothetical protein